MWLNKIFTATKVTKKAKESLPVRRKTFLYMLAYAEYHQRHVNDPVEHLKRVSQSADDAVRKYREGGSKASFEDSMDALSKMAATGKREAKRAAIGQKDENMMTWVEWRVDQLEKSVKYASSKGIVPLKASIGKATTLEPGHEISHDKFDIYSDAKKFLGEKMSLSELGY